MRTARGRADGCRPTCIGTYVGGVGCAKGEGCCDRCDVGLSPDLRRDGSARLPYAAHGNGVGLPPKRPYRLIRVPCVILQMTGGGQDGRLGQSCRAAQSWFVFVVR